MVATYTTTHEGFAAQRVSARHVEQIYTFAVWCKDDGPTGTNVWKCKAYSGSRNLAKKAAGQYRKFYRSVVIAPVTCKIRLSKRQKEWLETNASNAGKTHVY